MSRYKEFDQYEELLKGRLSKKRFTHTMNVAEACYDLAERFGGDKKRCYLAGMRGDRHAGAAARRCRRGIRPGSARDRR